jgi:RNA polymerase sigma-54 factor
MDMRLIPSHQMRQSLRQVMAPRMIQSMEILQLPLMALQERIDQELSENPVLVDLRESPTPDPDAEPTQPEPAQVDSEPEFEPPDDWDDGFAALHDHRPSRAALMEESDRKLEAMQNMAARPRTLQDHLADQLAIFDGDPVLRELAEYIIFNLDDNGYLHLPLTEVLRDFGGEATLDEAEDALMLVQRLDPPGVGARDLRECLLLQLGPDTPMRAELEVLIANHLEDIEHNRMPVIEKKSGIPIPAIKDALEHLRRLNPRPGSSFTAIENQFVLPDLIVEPDEHGHYQVRLTDEHVPQLSVSRSYQKMLRNKNADPAAREYIQKKIQAARWLIESIEQRRGTLLKVARAIVEHQKDFLDKGPEAIQPLKMQQIADLVGVHVTTVSRAVDDKWIQTPRGIYALRRFFGGGTTSADGEEVAWDTIKQKLLEMIAKEDKDKPLSDDDIANDFEKEGLKVARRTVTKYRKVLRIPSSRQRKEF